MKSKKGKPELNTVNVVEIVDGGIIGLASYPDNKAGNRLAEARFRGIVSENTERRLSERELNDMLDDGTCEIGNWKAVIFHSTE